jgi:hypothetical protein
MRQDGQKRPDMDIEEEDRCLIYVPWETAW